MLHNLGTIAKSGTENFSRILQEAGSPSELIGQFGVGFYSSFMVAKKVEVISKKSGENKAYLWSSEGEGEYSIDETKKEETGTEIILYIKEGEEYEEYLDKFRLEHIIKSYSSHIQTPIELIYDEGSSTIYNESSAIWLRNPSEVSEEEYNQAYNSIGGMPSGYFAKIHTKVEGTLEY